MKVLWLCSWYPNSADPFDGDFIERHAKSLAIHQEVDVLHFVQNVSLLKNESLRIEKRNEVNINTTVVFLPVNNMILKPFNAIFFSWNYYKQLRLQLKQYINHKGLPDIVHVHVPAKIGLGAVWLQKKYGIPFVITEHSTTYFPGTHDQFYERSLYYRKVVKKIFSSSDGLVSVSENLASLLIKLFPIKKTYLVRNAVDTKLFFPINTDNPVKKFIHVSMMAPFKNIEGILQALSILNEKNPNWSISFVGPASKEHRELAEHLGISNKVTWEGLLPYTMVAKKIQTADVLIHFSKYENLPCVINEALCCGLPIISSEVGGIAEIINKKNGYLVEQGNISQLVTAMSDFLTNSKQFDKMSIASNAMSIFNYYTIGEQLMNIYRNVLKFNNKTSV